VIPGDFQTLGTFAPGQTKQVQLSLAGTSAGPNFYTQPLSYSPYYNPGGGGSDDATRRRNALLGVALSGSSNSGYSYSQQDQGNWGIYLIGWVDDALVPASLLANPADNLDTTLYSFMLSPAFKFEPGALNIKPGLFIWDSSNPDITPNASYGQEVPQGGVVLSYRPAVALHYTTVKSLELNLRSNVFNSGSLINGVSISLWNWEKSAWDDLKKPTWGNIGITDPARYVGPGAEIRLRLDDSQSSSSSPAEFTSSAFTLVVQP